MSSQQLRLAGVPTPGSQQRPSVGVQLPARRGPRRAVETVLSTSVQRLRCPVTGSQAALAGLRLAGSSRPWPTGRRELAKGGGWLRAARPEGGVLVPSSLPPVAHSLSDEK